MIFSLAFARYRPEIDGLRAIAVLAVVMFHTQQPLFSGGYVGVDVFFVISGYLITRNILSYHERGLPVFKTFFISRARRLVPAFMVTLLLVGVASTIILTPYHLGNFAQSALASVLVVPNILFYMDAGYFQIDDLYRPLLHYWSLGVEGQFYMTWPVLLWLILSKRPKLVAPAIAVVFVASLTAAEYILSSDPEAAFFLLPFRLCEFMIGAACVRFTHSPITNPFARESVTALAIGIILACVFFFDRNTTFPGLAVLPVGLATGAVILIGPTRFVGRILNNPLSVTIGLISYSLYLVHWPMFTLYKYVRVESLSMIEGGVLVVSTFVVASAMYVFVERPFRVRVDGVFKMPGKVFGGAMVACTVLIAGMSFAMNSQDGWPWRFPAGIQDAIGNLQEKRDEAYAPLIASRDEPFPVAGKMNAVIIGDSLARDVYNAVAIDNPAIHFKKMTIEDRCQPMSGPRPNAGRIGPALERHCVETFRDILASDELAMADIVVLSASWRIWSIKAMPRTIFEIRERTDAPIIVFGVRMAFLDVPKLIVRYRTLDGVDAFVNRYQLKEKYKLNAMMKDAVAGLPGVTYVDEIELFCPNRICPVFTPDNKLVYYDKHHWTLSGARYKGRVLLDSGHPAGRMLFPYGGAGALADAVNDE